MHVLRYGERALLVEVADHHEALALYADLQGSPPDGLCGLVPAARTVLLKFTDEASALAAMAHLHSRPIEVAEQASGHLVEIPVVYDGPDLDEVARLTHLSVAQVLARHSQAQYTVAFTGFAPGFGYLTGLHPELRVPRRADPRTRVPAGSVAIAGEYSAVYPSASPGGWHLLGSTTMALWDLHREPPALLVPGTRVRFLPSGLLLS